MSESEPPTKKPKVQSTLNFFLRPVHRDISQVQEPAIPAAPAEPAVTKPGSSVVDCSVDAATAAQADDIDDPVDLAAANDIGHAVGLSLTVESRAHYMKPWIPTKALDYPSSIHKKSGVDRRRRLLPQHLELFPWLAVSKVPGKEGAFCTPCVLFVGKNSGVGGKCDGQGQLPGKFVTKPLTRFDDLTGKNGALNCHQQTDYHKRSVLALEEFKSVLSRGKADVPSLLNESHRRQLQQNREALAPIVDTILMCARQNIPLRGHRFELGGIAASAEEPEDNDGSFRALLRYRIRGGDAALKVHAECAKSNATYQSARIQNALLVCAGDLVKEAVVARIKKARFWSLIADETTDRQKREQLAVVIRYVLPDDNGVWKCYEDPIAVLDVLSDIKSNDDAATGSPTDGQETRLSGLAIGQTLLRIVTSLGLDLSICVGQGYDGASAMASERVGASSAFLHYAPLAFYFHCASHCLNLSAAQSVSVPSVSQAQAVVKEVSNCFRSSAKRTQLLKECISNAEDTRVSKTQLTTLCQTRFIERHTAIVTLRCLMRFVVEALDQMKTWQSSETRKTAHILSNSLCQSDFIVSFLVLEKVCAILLPTTRVLQTQGIDLVQVTASLV